MGNGEHSTLKRTRPVYKLWGTKWKSKEAMLAYKEKILSIQREFEERYLKKRIGAYMGLWEALNAA